MANRHPQNTARHNPINAYLFYHHGHTQPHIETDILTVRIVKLAVAMLIHLKLLNSKQVLPEPAFKKARIEGLTYQMDTPIKWTTIGLDLKLANRPPKDTLKFRRSGTILSGFSGVLLGPVLIALGPAL